MKKNKKSSLNEKNSISSDELTSNEKITSKKRSSLIPVEGNIVENQCGFNKQLTSIKDERYNFF